jgi:hypothetical protein
MFAGEIWKKSVALRAIRQTNWHGLVPSGDDPCVNTKQ